MFSLSSVKVSKCKIGALTDELKVMASFWVAVNPACTNKKLSYKLVNRLALPVLRVSAKIAIL